MLIKPDIHELNIQLHLQHCYPHVELIALILVQPFKSKLLFPGKFLKCISEENAVNIIYIKLDLELEF